MMNYLEFLSSLKDRLPSNRRMGDFYRKLDELMPDWLAVVNLEEFPDWMIRVDSQNGSCMFNRLRALWLDPLCSVEDFVVLLRIFLRWKKEVDSRKPKGWQILFHPKSVPIAIDTPYPVINDKYELLDMLGTGGNGEVYLAWSLETTSLYALKTIRRELAINPAVRQSFRDEAQSWVRLGEHPNVAKIYFFEDIHPSLYMAMAYVEGDENGVGPSLADKIAATSISVSKLCKWFCHVSDGLDHCYRHGIRAHRDIKSGNILIDRNGVAKISDFGLSVSTNEFVAAGMSEGVVAGTPLFMSPEQFLNSTNCDQRSDIYSLGITLYEAESGGNLPFTPSRAPKTPQDLEWYFGEIRSMHEKVKPKPIKSPFWPVIEKCLNKNPDDRFSNINEFRVAIEAIAQLQGLVKTERLKPIYDFWSNRDKGNSLMRLGNYEGAIKAFDAFISTMPDDGAILNRAICLENLGRISEALDVYEKFAIRNDILGLVNGSNCLRKLGRNTDAFTYAKQAVVISPDDKYCWIALGNAAFALKQWEESLKAYSAAQNIDSEDPTPIFNFALTAERLGYIEDVKTAYSAFLKLSLPDDSRRKHAEDMLKAIFEKE